MIVGHAHTPARADDVIQVGTSTYLRLSYNKGASNWAHAHSIIGNNGLAQLIIFVGGEYTTFNHG
jgi:hypothetical protein